jgi:hypothetical protein
MSAMTYKYIERRARCVVAKTDWKDIDGTVASVERVDGRNGANYTVVFTYEVNGHWCGGTFHTTDEYRVGDSVPVRYDPLDPDRNDLSVKEARNKWILWSVLIAVGLILLCVSFR